MSVSAFAGISFTVEDLGTIPVLNGAKAYGINSKRQAILKSIYADGSYFWDSEYGLVTIKSNKRDGIYYKISESGTVYGYNENKLLSWSLMSGETAYPIGKTGDNIRLFDCNLQDVVLGAISDPSLREREPVGFPGDSRIFTWNNGITKILPLRSKFKEIGYDTYLFEPLKINDKGHILGKCKYGQMHPFKNKWIQSGTLHFLWDGSNVHPILPPEGFYYHNNYQLQPDSSVKVYGSYYSGSIIDPSSLVGFSLEDNRPFAGLWSRSSCFVWKGHEQMCKKIETDTIGLLEWDTNHLRFSFEGECSYISAYDLTNLSGIDQQYPGAKIHGISGVNQHGQVVVYGLFYGECHPFLLTPYISP
jgi:hypothetical protein